MITVEQVLANNNIHFKSSETKFSIRCLSPEHEDRHPSMAVNKTTGDAQCFSCGYTTNVYKLFGIQISQANTKVMKLLRMVDHIRSSEIKIPDGCSPYTGDYRGIRQDLYEELNAFVNPVLFKDKVCFPIYGYGGEIRGIVHRDLYSNQARYGTYPKGCGILPLYPLKQFEAYKNTIIFVEGLFDAINMHNLGFKNVLCTFGTSTYKALLSEMLCLISARNISNVIIAFDNDDAGKSAASSLLNLFTSKSKYIDATGCRDFEVSIFDWESLPFKIKDFGELKSDQIFDVYNTLYGA